MKDAAKNVHGQVPAWTCVLFSLSFLPRGGISRPYSSSILRIWELLKNKLHENVLPD